MSFDSSSMNLGLRLASCLCEAAPGKLKQVKCSMSFRTRLWCGVIAQFVHSCVGVVWEAVGDGLKAGKDAVENLRRYGIFKMSGAL